LLICYRYIELNPVRANMVGDPAEYKWSSYRCNALGVRSPLCTPHREYLCLGKTSDECRVHYRDLFKYHIEGKLLVDVREALNKGLALGSEYFRDQVEALYGQRVKPAIMGRPKGKQRQ
jgi:putative transposase